MGRRSATVPLDKEALRRLSGERLQLRLPRLDDLAQVFHYASDPRASRFLAWSPHRDREETAAFLAGALAAWQGVERLAWVIEAAGEVVGMIEVKLHGRNAGIGYVIAPHAWGQGYASGALCLLSEALFRHSPVSAIWALCVVENPASACVLEKCGYQCERVIPAYFPCPNLGGVKHDVWRYVRYRHPTQSGAKPV